jgi:hypothetical protein
MKRPWKLTIEVGGDSPRGIESNTPSPYGVAVDTTAAWAMLVDARRKMLDAMAKGDDNKANTTVSWIGGALAAWGKMTGEDPASLYERLVEEVPNPNASPYGGMEFKKVERTRPEPHPGAQRVLDLSELTPEERDQLGITLPAADDV